MVSISLVAWNLAGACLFGAALSAAAWRLMGRLGTRKARPAILRLAAALAATFLFFAGAEVFLRWIVGPGRSLFPTEHPVVVDRLFLYRFRKNWSGMHGGVWVQTNSLGLRGPEVPPRQPGELRILCLGDSVTFGAHTSYEDSYPSLLQDRLRQLCAPRPVTVINAGIMGYNAYLGARLLEELGPACQPDLVLAAFFGNDRDSRLSYRAWSRHAAVLRLREVLARSEFYTALCALLQSLVGPPAPRPQRRGEEASYLAAYRDNLRALGEIARRLGARIVYLNMPIYPPYSPRQPAQMLAANDRMKAEMQRVAREEKAGYLDLRPAFERLAAPRQAELFGTDIHMLRAGHELVVDLLVAYLQEQGMVPRQAPGREQSAGSQGGAAPRPGGR